MVKIASNHHNIVPSTVLSGVPSQLIISRSQHDDTITLHNISQSQHDDTVTLHNATQNINTQQQQNQYLTVNEDAQDTQNSYTIGSLFKSFRPT